MEQNTKPKGTTM